MPVSCSKSVLTGQDGTVWFKPAGTSVCLRDFSDFPAGTDVSLPSCHGFLVGDEIEFAQEDGGKLDTAITTAIPAVDNVSGPFVITSIDNSTSPKAFTFATKAAPGTGITLNGDGGTGTADNPLPAHINVRLVDYEVVCQVANFSLSLTRDEIETTSLPCSVGGSGSCLAPFKTKQSGFADGTGTMEVNFTAEQTTLANRLIGDSLKKDQNGASVRLFINTVGGAAAGEVDLANSLYIEAPIVILGFSFDVSPEEAITAEISFSFSGQPTHILSADVG